jgi:hypothetical protein
MRRLVAAAFVMALMVAVPAQAQEAPPIGCVEVDLEWSGNTPLIKEVTYRDEGVRTATVGSFLWIQFNSDGSADSDSNVASVEIPDGALTAAACLSQHDITSTDFTAETISASVVAVPDSVPLAAETVTVWVEIYHKVAHGWLIE